MENNKNCVTLKVAKLLKKVGWHLGSDFSYVKDAFLKDNSKKLWGTVDSVDDILYYCHAMNEDGTKTYPDLNEKDWITWKYTLTSHWWRNDLERPRAWEPYEAPLISEVLTRLEDEKHFCVSIICKGYKSYTYEIREYVHKPGTREYQVGHFYNKGIKTKEDWYTVVNEAITVILEKIIEDKANKKQTSA